MPQLERDGEGMSGDAVRKEGRMRDAGQTQSACRGKYLHNQPFSVARDEYGITQKPAVVRA